MTLHEFLRKEASDYAMIAKEESRQIATDLKEAEQLGHDLAARRLGEQLQGKYEIQKRLRTYSPEKGMEKPDCPWCWMMNGNHSPLKAVPPPADILEPTSIYFFRCHTCETLLEFDESSGE